MSQPYRVPLVNFTYTGHPTGMQWWSLQWSVSGSPELMWSHCEAVKVLTTASWGNSCGNKMADTSQLYSTTTCLYCCNNENKVLLHQMKNSILSHLRKTSSMHVQFYTPVRSQCIPFILANSHTGIVFLTIYGENSELLWLPAFCYHYQKNQVCTLISLVASLVSPHPLPQVETHSAHPSVVRRRLLHQHQKRCCWSNHPWWPTPPRSQ